MKLLPLVLIILLAVPVSGQTPQRRFKIDALDAAWAGTIVADQLSTNYALNRCSRCYEGSPIKQPALRMSLQFGALGAVKWLEYRYPKRRTALRIFKGAMIGLELFVIGHNIQKGRR